MQLKTLFSKAVLKKDLTRFVPAMALYALFLLLLFFMYLTQGDMYWIVRDVASVAQGMAVINFIYAPVCALLLFGDLFNARMCNALHAMPLRRETWFGSHVLAGLLFSLLPNLLITGISAAVMGEFYYVALLWLLASTLQYVFFFGAAVFCSYLVGSRFAMSIVYLLVNFFSMFVYWLVDTLIRPLLYGIEVDLSWFQWFSPVIRLADGVEYIAASRVMDPVTGEYTDEILAHAGEGWWYAMVCAVLGVAFLAGTLALYRRRKMESAGDFMAFKALSPVFLIIYSIAAGTFCQMFFSLFVGTSTDYPYLFIGLVVGYYTGRMLLRRTLRVFQLRSLIGLGALLASAVLVLVGAYFDVIGVTRWVPEASEVESVTLYQHGYKSGRSYITLTAEEDIEQILDFHSMIAADVRGYEQNFFRNEYWEAATTSSLLGSPELLIETEEKSENPGANYQFLLEYTLTNGDTAERYYDVYTLSEPGRMLHGFFSRPVCVMGEEILDLPAFMEDLTAIRTDWEGIEFPVEAAPELLHAIMLDCSNGSMVQSWPYHNDDRSVLYLVFERLPEGTDHYHYTEITVYDNCTNTLAWLEDNCDMESIYEVVYTDYVKKYE